MLEKWNLEKRNAFAKRLEILYESETISKWVSKIIGTNLHSKLVNVGLLEKIKDTHLGSFIDAYNASRTDVKEWTRKIETAQKKEFSSFLTH